ncbi:MAG: hypothetical protein ACKPKO_55575, partial [Candidatus Fonsibacter sp.]
KANDLTTPRINLATGLIEYMPCKPSWYKGSSPAHAVATRILGKPSRMGRTTMTTRKLVRQAQPAPCCADLAQLSRAKCEEHWTRLALVFQIEDRHAIVLT